MHLINKHHLRTNKISRSAGARGRPRHRPGKAGAGAKISSRGAGPAGAGAETISRGAEVRGEVFLFLSVAMISL